ncbi:SDR family NAD(P)-dependent oxidoreductase [Paracandidimonas soli]|uniref:NAD(P)-dependent dehydrogenase (Short-subunit alcohol dehydrogenase family) n=1 Tax=Paracandidimonas soli TaxID=1917182 RepID=A0A4R3VCE8_9BURK|nr:SDR family oxidoreductase [Paracandidimonas soli]TCV02997.1 NAD(P)-dependent dehydrogenase (short-subunit alcohol dehydrogenase family) [Paracandidimonas soli]
MQNNGEQKEQSPGNDLPGILITGGSRGIGAAFVRLAAAQGHPICFTYIAHEEKAQALVDELTSLGARIACIQADTGDAASISGLFRKAEQQIGPIGVLINNAGITGPLGPFPGVTEDVMRSVLNVNVLGPMLLSQQAANAWKSEDREGCILNVSSTAARLGSPGEYVHYAAAKGALESFTVGLAKELAADGIRVNAVAPATTLTDIHATMGEPDRPARVAKNIPMRRPGQPDEIAEAMLWLISDKASYVTGAILPVAGGL